MLTLCILRHANTLSGSPDFERSLSPQGKLEADSLAKWMHAEPLLPDVVLCSSAKRVLQTLAPLREIQQQLLVVERKSLYGSTWQTLLDEIGSIPSNNKCVMVAAHNPGVSYLCSYLCTENQLFFEPGAMAILQFEVDDWNALSKGLGSLVHFRAPSIQ